MAESSLHCLSSAFEPSYKAFSHHQHFQPWTYFLRPLTLVLSYPALTPDSGVLIRELLYQSFTHRATFSRLPHHNWSFLRCLNFSSESLPTYSAPFFLFQAKLLYQPRTFFFFPGQQRGQKPFSTDNDVALWDPEF